MRGETAWVRDGEVLVHIGLPKTSTTAMQSALAAARPRLEAQGVLYPGTALNQWTPAFDLVGLRSPGHWADPDPYLGRNTWSSLVREVGQSPLPRCVVSAECLTWATPDQIDRLVRDLGSVRVLVTVRSLEQLLPSLWQQDLKRGLDLTLEQWLEVVLVQGRSVNNRLSNPETFDIPAVAERWADRVGIDRLAIAIVPSPGRASTTDRSNLDHLESLVGLVPGTLEPVGQSGQNRGLTNAEAEVIRRVNSTIDTSTMSYAFYRDRLRRPAIEAVAAQRQPTQSESRIALPAWAVERCRQLGRRHVTEIEELGVLVAGDLAELVPVGPIPPAPSEPSGEALADVAADIVHRLVGADIPRGRPHPLQRWLPPVCVPVARGAYDGVRALGRRRHGVRWFARR